MRRSIATLLLGVLCAVIAVLLLNNYVQTLSGGGTEQAAPAIELAPVVVAAAELSFGNAIDREGLKVVAWPTASVPEGSFGSIEEVFEGATEPGDRVALTLIGADEPVTRTKISGFGARPILSQQVSNSMRAVSISVNDVLGVSGFVLPGDRVDIMLTRQIGNGPQNLINDIILQNITVLGINQVADQAAEEPIVGQTATVEVSTEQAQKLALAQQAGTLSLVLRGFEDVEMPTTRRVTQADLGTARPAPQAAAVQRQPTVRVRYGDGTVVARQVPQ